MAFDASKTVSALEYNFAPFQDVKGCTPEPSTDAVRHFLYETGRLADEAVGGGTEGDSDEAIAEKIRTMTEEDYTAIAEEILDLTAELTQGEPSRDEIAALPHRIQRAYMAWLRKELTDPEAPSAGTRRSLKGLPGGARSTSRAGG